MAEIEWLDRALDSLIESLEYIAIDNEQAAEKLATKVDTKIERLAIFPLSGHKLKEIINASYLEITINPFRIFYTYDEGKDIVYIKDVFSSKQDVFSHLSEQHKNPRLKD